MTKTKTLFLILTLAAATATACARTVGVTGTDNQPRIINIVNFIRQTDYRVEDSDRKLYETVCRQVELVNRYDLPATFLLEYDALINPLYQKLLKTKLRNGAEIGAWWELTQPHIEAAGLKWRGEHPWVSHANIAFSTGYTKEERERLVDVYMRKFKDIFGTYPKSVGSWFIDAHTLAYMHDRYGIEASCNCKDQIGTDGYTLWGGYWNQAYYPSRLNAYMPAQTGAGQIPVPVFRMLGSDPIYQYDDGLGNERQGVISLEPVYKHAGMNRKWVDYFFDALTDEAIAKIPTDLYREGMIYYGRTHRHPNSTFRYTTASLMELMSWDATDQIKLIDAPLLMMAGEKADSLYMTLDAFAKATGTNDKELYLVPGATHISTYHVPEYVDLEVAKLKEFFGKHL